MKYTKLAVTLTSFALFVPAVFAQSATTTTAPATIEQRKDNQQQRIGNGVENGSLTAGEASRIEKRESNLNKETNAMRAADGGKLTPQDRRIVNRQQNRLSQNIYNQKHDAQVQPKANNEVNARQRLQQQRIGQGIKSGQLTPGETAKLEHKDTAINHEVNKDRQANGGTLTPAERARVNRQQNKVSQQIYAKKHNGRVQK
jgi:D-lyxose ketol-isomerase